MKKYVVAILILVMASLACAAPVGARVGGDFHAHGGIGMSIKVSVIHINAIDVDAE